MTLALRSLKRFAWGSVVVLFVFILITLDQEFGVAPRILEALRRMNE